MLPPRLLAGLTGLATLVPLLLTTAAGPAAADPEVRRLAGADLGWIKHSLACHEHGLEFPD